MRASASRKRCVSLASSAPVSRDVRLARACERAPIAHHAAGPVRAATRRDAVGEGGEARRILEAAQPAEDGEPGLLDCVLRGVPTSREAEGVGGQPGVPAREELGERVGVCGLGAQHEELVVNALGGSRHLAGKVARDRPAVGGSGQPSARARDFRAFSGTSGRLSPRRPSTRRARSRAQPRKATPQPSAPARHQARTRERVLARDQAVVRGRVQPPAPRAGGRRARASGGAPGGRRAGRKAEARGPPRRSRSPRSSSDVGGEEVQAKTPRPERQERRRDERRSRPCPVRSAAAARGGDHLTPASRRRR